MRGKIFITNEIKLNIVGKEQCTGGNTKDIETSCSYTQNVSLWKP